MSSERVTILGATGSIGKSTLDVIDLHPDKFEIFALTANVQVDALFVLCEKWQPSYAVMRDSDAAEKLSQRLSKTELPTIVLSGEEGLCQVASDSKVDVVVAAIVGAAGLSSGFAAAQAGKKILLANKESLVMSGDLFMQTVRENKAILLPIDSEHNAIFQSLPSTYACGEPLEQVSKILLTASGGPFRSRDVASFSSITPEEACAHPNWDMGQKISVDSATMMNKGLEFIEACHLFACEPSKIEIVVHPQSVIHSMVEYVDGSVLAQLGQPDMCIPIAHALAWPQRFKSGASSLDLIRRADLSFEDADLQRFPCLDLAMQAMRSGQAASIALNAANEIAVDAFLQKKISYTSIAGVIEKVLNKASSAEPSTLSAIKEHDLNARALALENITAL